MLTHILSLLGLILLCVLWVVFQSWLAKQDDGYEGYKAGCGGCTRSCGEKTDETCESTHEPKKTKTIDASSLWAKHS